MGSKQKLLDWIWKHTPDDVESVADAFPGSVAWGLGDDAARDLLDAQHCVLNDRLPDVLG